MKFDIVQYLKAQTDLLDLCAILHGNLERNENDTLSVQSAADNAIRILLSRDKEMQTRAMIRANHRFKILPLKTYFSNLQTWAEWAKEEKDWTREKRMFHELCDFLDVTPKSPFVTYVLEGKIFVYEVPRGIKSVPVAIPNYS